MNNFKEMIVRVILNAKIDFLCYNYIKLNKDKMLWKCNIAEPYYTQICNGVKCWEGRLYKNKWKDMKSGDYLEINNEITIMIREVTPRYADFGELYLNLGEALLPGVKSVDEARSVYLRVYDQSEIDKYGVIAIKL